MLKPKVNKGYGSVLQAGFGLMEVVIAAGILSILMLGLISVIVNQQREIQSMGEMLAALDFKKTAMSALSNGSVCKYLLNNPTTLTFNASAVTSTNPQILTPSLPVYASVNTGPPLVLGPVVAEVGQPPSIYSSRLVVKSIKLSISGAPSPLPSAPGVKFTADWLFEFDSTKLVRPVKPISVSTILTADTTVPSSATVTGCQSGGGGGGGGACPAGQVISGVSSDGTAICSPGFIIGGYYILHTGGGGGGSWECLTPNTLTGGCTCPAGMNPVLTGMYWQISEWDRTTYMCM